MSTVPRRLVSVGGLLVAAVMLLLLVPVWIPVAAVVDLVRRRLRLPTVRLLLFALGWSWLESASVVLAFGLWLTGQRNNHDVHYRLQAWWAANVLGLLRATTGIRVSVEGVDQLTPGPAILLCRHASLADSLVSAWVVTSLAGLQPRYVLKRELLADPCLDIVGNRLPNHFLDRQATDSRAELDALTRLSTGMGTDDVAVIFPEERDPDRAARLDWIATSAPPEPRWLRGADRRRTRCRHRDRLARRLRWARHVRRHPSSPGPQAAGSPVPGPAHTATDVPSGEAFTEWLDETWLQADRDVHDMLEPAS